MQSSLTSLRCYSPQIIVICTELVKNASEGILRSQNGLKVCTTQRIQASYKVLTSQSLQLKEQCPLLK